MFGGKTTEYTSLSSSTSASCSYILFDSVVGMKSSSKGVAPTPQRQLSSLPLPLPLARQMYCPSSAGSVACIGEADPFGGYWFGLAIWDIRLTTR